MEYGVQFYEGSWRDADDTERPLTVGVGTDQTIWLPARELGIRAEDMEGLEDYPGPLMLFSVRQQRVFVNARAMAETLSPPELRAQVAEIGRASCRERV